MVWPDILTSVTNISSKMFQTKVISITTDDNEWCPCYINVKLVKYVTKMQTFCCNYLHAGFFQWLKFYLFWNMFNFRWDLTINLATISLRIFTKTKYKVPKSVFVIHQNIKILMSKNPTFQNSQEKINDADYHISLKKLNYTSVRYIMMLEVQSESFLVKRVFFSLENFPTFPRGWFLKSKSMIDHRSRGNQILLLW